MPNYTSSPYCSHTYLNMAFLRRGLLVLVLAGVGAAGRGQPLPTRSLGGRSAAVSLPGGSPAAAASFLSSPAEAFATPASDDSTRRRSVAHGATLTRLLHKTTMLRGGAKPPKKNVANALTAAVNNVTPTTRMYLLGCLVMACLTLVGIPEVRDTSLELAPAPAPSPASCGGDQNPQATTPDTTMYSAPPSTPRPCHSFTLVNRSCCCSSPRGRSKGSSSGDR